MKLFCSHIIAKYLCSHMRVSKMKEEEITRKEESDDEVSNK